MASTPTPPPGTPTTPTPETPKVPYEPEPSPFRSTSDKKGGGVRGWLRSAIFDNASIKIVALVLSVTVFILVNTGDAVINIRVGIIYTMPQDRVLVSTPVDSVRIAISGSWRRIKRFDEREIGRIHIDLRKQDAGEYVLDKGMFKLPPGIKLVSMDPRSIRLSFEKRDSRSVPVVVPTEGKPMTGYMVASVTTTPSQVTIRGAKSSIKRIETLFSAKVSLNGRTTSFTQDVSLTSPEKFVDIEQPKVTVRVEVAEEQVTRVVNKVPITIRGANMTDAQLAKFKTDPETVDVTLHGPLLAVQGATAGTLVAYIRVFPDDVYGNKPRRPEVVVEVPKGIGSRVEPRQVVLQIKKPDKVDKPPDRPTTPPDKPADNTPN